MSTRTTSTSRLEVENQQMENRIRLLKEMMSAEKTRRELDGGIHWQSGRSGPLQRETNTMQPAPGPSNNSLQSRNLSQKKPMKVKILTDKNICKQTMDRKANLPKCGQCEKASALLNCVECIENYCQLCFTKMHQKGSLAKHHVKPILQKVKHLSPKKVDNGLASQAALQSPQGKHSLLEGTYDEAASAKSFQEALAEWRGENPVKGSNTYAVRESSVVTKSETPTMAATTQVDMNPGSKAEKLSVEFSDANKVTYFEKLLLRKFRDSPVFLRTDHSTEGNEDQVVSSKSEEDDNVNTPTVSQYNLFYDAELMDTEPGSSCVEADTFEAFDFYSAPSGIVVEEVPSTTTDQSLCSVEVTPLEPVPVATTSAIPTAREEEGAKSSANSQVPKARNGDSKQAAQKGKKKKGQKERKRQVNVQQDSKQPDFSLAVKAAWSTCTQSDHGQQQMTQFFLHGVKPAEDVDQEMPVPKPFPTELLDAHQFTLGSAVWLPSSSLQPTDPGTSPNEPRNETPPLAPPSRPATRDYYYDDDTDSDSEDAEYERAAFISSRLGMARDSIQELEPKPEGSYRELEEEEERMERDKADCQCLDELAWELASTVECEGRLTRCEGELDQLDQEEGVDDEVGCHSGSATPVHQDAEDIEIPQVDVDMSKVISEFELYQRELMEEDCM